MNITHVILTGGVGSRLWPLSRKSFPKQYIPLFEDGHSLFQLCILRNRPISGKLIVVGNRNNRDLSRKNLTDLNIQKFDEITESVPRNTAAAIAFSAFNSAPDDILLITPSDHIISNPVVYQEAVKHAAKLAEAGSLVTFGIHPTRPETGYGYIAHRENTVLSFIEKPDLENATKMLAKGNYLWNSGMFCFQAGVFLNALKKYAPKVFEKAKAAWEQAEEGALPEAASLEIPAISVDYAVMEQAQDIKVIPMENVGWSDLGTFESLGEYLKTQNKPETANSNLIIGTKKPVFFIGEEQMIYVETDDAILILPKQKSQEVKQLYEQLEKEQPGLVE